MKTDLSRLEAGALRAGLSRLLNPTGYFDICTFDNMLKVAGCVPDARTRDALRLLHCVNWSSMDRVTRDVARTAILGTFEADAELVGAFVAAFEDPAPAPAPVSVFRRLLGGVK